MHGVLFAKTLQGHPWPAHKRYPYRLKFCKQHSHPPFGHWYYDWGLAAANWVAGKVKLHGVLFAKTLQGHPWPAHKRYPYRLKFCKQHSHPPFGHWYYDWGLAAANWVAGKVKLHGVLFAKTLQGHPWPAHKRHPCRLKFCK
ncbi:hypothetical protein DS2_06306 [Catenovulum agarivorans DS-2]|uniref:Uncharacterized protein n=1 Tax=Catenovulum agarivorans DS-2 TaxID=1328313 RepID=W7QG45_9ALTE|nr:hypothetical protein DS2_06306 [Catenovulum agarivorans DS-2]